MMNEYPVNYVCSDSDLEGEHAKEAAYEAKCKALMTGGQRLLAQIRPTSKYFRLQGKNGALFPVAVGLDDEYRIIGGPGGRYRLCDVHLFAVFSEAAEPIQITFD